MHGHSFVLSFLLTPAATAERLAYFVHQAF
jgi:hypothetical protein